MIETKDVARRLRETQNISQEELAELLAVSRQTVYRWESGESVPSSDNMLRMREMYGVSLDGLMSGKLPPRPEQEYRDAQRKKARLALAAALLLAAGILIGVWCFAYAHREPATHFTQVPGEVVDFSAIGNIPMLPPVD